MTLRDIDPDQPDVPAIRIPPGEDVVRAMLMEQTQEVAFMIASKLCEPMAVTPNVQRHMDGYWVASFPITMVIGHLIGEPTIKKGATWTQTDASFVVPLVSADTSDEDYALASKRLMHIWAERLSHLVVTQQFIY